MKENLLTIFMYILLTLIVFAIGTYWAFIFYFDDIVNYYLNGILKPVFLLIILGGILLPILKYRKYKQKWILPIILSAFVLITPIFNNGILKFIEDNLEIYSKEKWEQNENLRIYMIDDLETHYIYKGMRKEQIKNLLGEPDFLSEETSQYYECNVSPGFMEPIRFFIKFENDLVAETGKLYT